MRAAKVQASLHIRAVSPEPSLLAHTSSESRGTFRQKARSLTPLNVWACAIKICHDGMLEDTNSLDGAQLITLDRWNVVLIHMSHVMRKSVYAICEHQRCRSACASASWADEFESNLVANPEDRFSHDKAHLFKGKLVAISRECHDKRWQWPPLAPRRRVPWKS